MLDVALARQGRPASALHGAALKQPDRTPACAGLRAAVSDCLRTFDAFRVDGALVLLVDLSEWMDGLQQARELIDSEQSARVDRRRSSVQRAELTLAYAMHRLVLGWALDIDPTRVPLMREPSGKPYVKDSTLATSLSHTCGFVAIGLCRSSPMGIDLERIDRALELPEIAALVCHATEAELACGDPLFVGMNLLELWVRKESVLKAAGVGLAYPMSDFAAPLGQVLRLPVTTRAPIRLRMLDAGPSCVAAIATRPGVSVQCRWIRPRTWTEGARDHG